MKTSMNRTFQRKYHYIYKITRFDGMYYIGMHSTDNLDDGYFGSGQLLWHSIKYHGKDKHTKEILGFLPTRKDLILQESKLVDSTCLKDPKCLNLRLGGSYEYRKEESEQGKQNRINGVKAFYADIEKSSKARKKISEANTGKKHTEETCKKLSIAAPLRIEKQKACGQWAIITEKNRLAHIGKPQTVETIQKRNESVQAYKNANGGKRTFSEQACKNIGDAQCGTAKNAQEWKITSNDGTVQIIENLSKWLAENGLVKTRDRTGIREPAKPGLVKPVLFALERIS